jgi:hypothetical protein
MDSLIPQVLPEHLRYDNFEFATKFINFIPDEQGLFSISKQVWNMSNPGARSLRLSSKLSINLNATLGTQDIPWP